MIGLIGVTLSSCWDTNSTQWPKGSIVTVRKTNWGVYECWSTDGFKIHGLHFRVTDDLAGWVEFYKTKNYNGIFALVYKQ